MNLAEAKFEQFSADHFGALIAIGVATAALAVVLRRAGRRSADNRTRRGICASLAILLLALGVGEQIYEIARGWWTVEESLPLHLCDLALVVTIITLMLARRADAGVHSGRRQVLFELTYFWALGGTVQALATPELAFPFPHALYFAFFASHGGIVAAVLVMAIGLGLRPRRWFVFRVWLITNLVAAPVLLLNWLSGANYMYLNGPPKNPSLYDYFGPWPWSLLTLQAVGIVALLLLYAPFWIMNRFTKKDAPRRSDPPRDV